MTKTFCDVCGKELTTQEQMNAYNIAITSKNKTFPYTRNYSEVCEDCADRITGIIDALKEETND